MLEQEQDIYQLGLCRITFYRISDCSGVNVNGPGRFRTIAENPAEQVCYFNMHNNDQLFDVFVSKRINSNNSPAGIYFQIDNIKSKKNTDTFDARVVYCYKMAQAMMSQHKSMDVDLDLDNIGLEMVELLGGLKQQSIDQLDQNFMIMKHNKNLKKGKINRNENKNKDIL